MNIEKIGLRDNEDVQHTNELLKRSENVLDSAINLIAELDGKDAAEVREKLAEDMSRPTELQQIIELEKVKENLRAAYEGRNEGQVSFGQSVEERCKVNELKNAIENGQKIAAENRARELSDMIKKEQMKKEKKAQEEKEKKEKEERTAKEAKK